MAAVTQHSQKAITAIISEMTRPVSELLGEAPLTPLETRARKRARPLPLRSHHPPSDADIRAITSAYPGPAPLLPGGRVPADLALRKRPRLESRAAPPEHPRKRRREEKPPRPDVPKKREPDAAKKPRPEEPHARPLGIKLTSQPNPRQAAEQPPKKPRASGDPPPRKKDDALKQVKKESKKASKADSAKPPAKDSKEKSSKESSRKRPVLRIPASVIPRSEPRPPKPSVPTNTASDVDHATAKQKKNDMEQKRLAILRVPSSEPTERHRRDTSKQTSEIDSSEKSALSPERRRPRSRQLNTESSRQRDRESDTDRERERREKPRDRDRAVSREDKERESDREPTREKDRDREARRSAREDRGKGLDKGRARGKERRDRDKNRGRDRERDQDRDKVRDRKRERDVERERDWEKDGKQEDDKDRLHRERQRDRDRDFKRESDRTSLRRSVPPSGPDSARDSNSVGQSPREGRGTPVTSKTASRNGPPQSPTRDAPKSTNARARHGPAELSQVIAKQKDLEQEFKATLSRCEETFKNKDYDAYEKVARKGFRLSFDIGLAKETEFRLQAAEFRSLNAQDRTSRKRSVINHYKYLTKTYVPTRTSELEKIGRKDACAFYKRGIQKVYFRMFCFHRLWEKDVQHSNASLQRLLSDVIRSRKEGGADKTPDGGIPTRKVNLLSRLVEEHVNILTIIESISSDFGSGYEDAGAEAYVP